LTHLEIGANYEKDREFLNAIVGMILFAAILLGLPGRPAHAVESTATERDIYPTMNEEKKKDKRRLKAAA
jgi:hypothetical protein